GLTLNQSAVAAALDNSFNTGGGAFPRLVRLRLPPLPAALGAPPRGGGSGTQETAVRAAGKVPAVMMGPGAVLAQRGDIRAPRRPVGRRAAATYPLQKVQDVLQGDGPARAIPAALAGVAYRL